MFYLVDEQLCPSCQEELRCRCEDKGQRVEQAEIGFFKHAERERRKKEVSESRES